MHPELDEKAGVSRRPLNRSGGGAHSPAAARPTSPTRYMVPPVLMERRPRQFFVRLLKDGLQHKGEAGQRRAGADAQHRVVWVLPPRPCSPAARGPPAPGQLIATRVFAPASVPTAHHCQPAHRICTIPCSDCFGGLLPVRAGALPRAQICGDGPRWQHASGQGGPHAAAARHVCCDGASALRHTSANGARQTICLGLPGPQQHAPGCTQAQGPPFPPWCAA